MPKPNGAAQPAPAQEKKKQANPPPGTSALTMRRSAALERLRVSPQQLDAAPQITAILKNAAGGWKAVLTALRIAQDETISAFLVKYDSIPSSDREYLPIEAVLLAAGINIHNFLGLAMMALQSYSVHAVKTIIVTNHPRVAQARVNNALRPGGVKDRDAIDTATGLLPSPKGQTFIGKAIFGAGKQVMGAQDAGDDEEETAMIDAEIDLERLFPPANRMQERLNVIRQRALPEPAKGEESPTYKRLRDDRRRAMPPYVEGEDKDK